MGDELRQPSPVRQAHEAALLERIAARIHLPREKLWLLRRRVDQRRSQIKSHLSLAGYAALLERSEGADELRQLFEAVRVGETRFCRLGDQQRALRRVALPELAARRENPLEVWSAGCATGEEAYTVAMVIDDWLRSVAREDLGYRVLATDLSADALETARAGQYSRRAVAGIPGDLRERYFTAQGDGHRVRPALAERVRFQRHDLTEQPFPGGIDLVFCRNVLIYFRRSTREAVARRLSTSLALHGFLFLGEGEALQPCPEAFQMLRTPDGLIYQRTSAVIEGPRREGPAPEPEPPLPTTPDPHVVRLQGSYEEGAEQRLAGELRGSLEKSRPLVVVDLDGATYLADGCAHLLQRLASNLEQGRLVLVASRPGVVRWISRHADQLEGIPHRRTVAEAGDRSDR